MKIKNVRLREEGDYIFLEAECKIRHIGTDRVYFKFEKKYRDFLVADACPFAAALLVPSMKMGQDLIIEGRVSKKLLEGMNDVMEKMLSWPIKLKRINIIATEATEDPWLITSYSGAFFSGGVDCFYTYLRHKYQGEKPDYLILANGFDISLDNPGLWEETCKMADDIAEKESVDMIKVESNIRSLIEPVEIWDYTHGGCLAAIGLALRNKLSTVYVPSSLAYGQLLPWGSHPELDSLWSTEAISFCHDGADMRRVDKVRFISRDPLALENLRVCYINAEGKFNCGVCDKCLRTMINLRIADRLEEAHTFPSKLDKDLVAGITISGQQNAILHRENLNELEERGIEPEIQDILRQKLDEFEHPRLTFQKLISKSRYYLEESLNEIRQLDFFYNQDRLYKSKKAVTQGFRKNRGNFREKISSIEKVLL